MKRRDTRKKGLDPLAQYRKEKELEAERRFHEASEPDEVGWHKRQSSHDSRQMKGRKLATTGQIIPEAAKPKDTRTRYKTRNGVTWRVVKSEKELQAEAEKEAEREALRQQRSYAHRNDKGRPITTRFVIKLNVVGYPKPYYYGGDEIGWTTYECAIQYLGKRHTLQYANRLIKNLKLEDNTDRYESIEVVNIPHELNKEWLYEENVDWKLGTRYEEEVYETHEEFVEQKRQLNESRDNKSCENCLCNTCGTRKLGNTQPCFKCNLCKMEKEKPNWRDECERYRKAQKSL